MKVLNTEMAMGAAVSLPSVLQSSEKRAQNKLAASDVTIKLGLNDLT